MLKVSLQQPFKNSMFAQNFSFHTNQSTYGTPVEVKILFDKNLKAWVSTFSTSNEWYYVIQELKIIKGTVWDFSAKKYNPSSPIPPVELGWTIQQANPKRLPLLVSFSFYGWEYLTRAKNWWNPCPHIVVTYYFGFS